MDLLSVILLAVGLAMDCLAVSSMRGIQRAPRPWLMAVLFGVFQGGMPLIGYAAGSAFATYVDKYDHWIALILLALIGGKMILESREPKENSSPKAEEMPAERRSMKSGISELFLLAIATSIDALATGIIFVPYSFGSVLLDMAIIAIVSFLFSLLGYDAGRRAGKHLSVNVELLGGLVLIGIGIKIFIEGMGWL